MYTMKEACEKTGLRYETLKFYCNQGLVPNVKRDSLNRRVFDDRDIGWINSLNCLKSCNMGMEEMRQYLALCLQGPDSIPVRKQVLAHKREELLAHKREELLAQRQRIDDAIAYLDWKQGYYDEVLSGQREYTSNLRPGD